MAMLAVVACVVLPSVPRGSGARGAKHRAQRDLIPPLIPPGGATKRVSPPVLIPPIPRVLAPQPPLPPARYVESGGRGSEPPYCGRFGKEHLSPKKVPDHLIAAQEQAYPGFAAGMEAPPSVAEDTTKMLRAVGANESLRCDGIFGLKSLHRYGGKDVPLCISTKPGGGSLSCRNPTDNKLWMCQGTRLRFHPAEFHPAQVNSKGAVVSSSQGAMSSDCRVTPIGQNRPEYRHTWSTKAQLLNSLSLNKTDGGCKAGDTLLKGTTFAVQRINFGQPFHSHEDIYAAWTTFLALGLNPEDTRVFLTDTLPDGPFLPFWRAAFGPRHAVLRREKMGNKSYCFER
eukprot:Hpha_TRINITY_DN1650_c0_g1::TRINITY_DN1650_c0_g1_i1::g.48815::m.48815